MRYVWHVEGSLSPTEDRKWRKNVKLTIFSSDLELVVKAAKDRYSGIDIVKVMRDRQYDAIIIIGTDDEE